MAGTTTNYGWTYPTSTDYVKDGATAIQTLATGIDTSLNDALGTKPAMGVLLKTTTFSAQNTVTIDSVFTSSYQNYRIEFSGFTCASAGSLTIQMRAGGVTAAGNNYRWARVYSSSAGTTGGGGVFDATNGVIAYFSSGGANACVFDLIQPQVAAGTTWSGTYFEHSSAAPIYAGTISGVHNVSTSYDGVIFTFSGVSSSGTIRIYGYRNS